VEALRSGMFAPQEAVTRFELAYARWWLPRILDERPPPAAIPTVHSRANHPRIPRVGFGERAGRAVTHAAAHDPRNCLTWNR
jgi:hypothetical protein